MSSYLKVATPITSDLPAGCQHNRRHTVGLSEVTAANQKQCWWEQWGWTGIINKFQGRKPERWAERCRAERETAEMRSKCLWACLYQQLLTPVLGPLLKWKYQIGELRWCRQTVAFIMAAVELRFIWKCFIPMQEFMNVCFGVLNVCVLMFPACRRNPCRNEGTCRLITSTGKEVCNCRRGYGGADCSFGEWRHCATLFSLLQLEVFALTTYHQ